MINNLKPILDQLYNLLCIEYGLWSIESFLCPDLINWLLAHMKIKLQF